MAVGQENGGTRGAAANRIRAESLLVRLAVAGIRLRPGQGLRAGTGVVTLLRHGAGIVLLATLVMLSLTMLALTVLVVLPLLRVLLALPVLLPAFVVSVDHPVVMLGVLIVVLSRDAITRRSRIARQGQILLEHLVGIAADANFRPGAVEGLRPTIGHMGLVAAIVPAALALHVHGASISFTSGIAGFLVEPGGARRFHQHDSRYRGVHFIADD